MSQDRTAEFFTVAKAIPSPPAGGVGGVVGVGIMNKAPSFHSQTTMPHDNTSGRYGQSTQQYPGSSTTAPIGSGAAGNIVTAAGAQGQTQHPPDAYTELREFHNTATTISTDIAKTSSMLSELTHLVRRRNLFVDDTDRVNSLVLSIKHNIESLNTRLDEAGRTIARRRRKLGKHSQVGLEGQNLVDQLREEFVRATRGFKTVLQQRSDGMKEQEEQKLSVFGQSAATIGGSGGAQDKNGGGMMMGGASAGGSMALGNRPPVYSDHHGGGGVGAMAGGLGGGALNGQLAAGRSNMIPTLDLTSAYMGLGAAAAADGSGMSAGESTNSGVGSSSSSLPRPRGVYGEGGGSSSFGTPEGLRVRKNSHGSFPSMYNNNNNNNSGGGPQQQHQPLTPHEIQRLEEQNGMAQSMQLIPDQNHLRDRADAMSTVESNIVELGTIFNKLAVMVSEHRDLVQRVEDNVEEASDNINLSLATLVDTLDGLRTNRALFMKVFGIIVTFIILFITFFA